MKKKAKNSDAVKPEKSVLRENVEAIIIAIILALFIRTFCIQAFKIPSGSMLETLQIGDQIIVNKFIYGVKIPFLRKTVIPVSEPKHDDIVVFIYPVDKRDFIKRVIAVEGDTIEIKNRKVYVNGKWTGKKAYEKLGKNANPKCPIKAKEFEQSWLKDIDAKYKHYQSTGTYPPSDGCLRDNFGPVTVPKDSLFVMGDNRDNSLDSRFWGFVPLDAVKGKAFIIYWSWYSQGAKSFGDKLLFWKWVRWNRIGDILR